MMYRLFFARLITKYVLLFEHMRDSLWRAFFWTLFFFGLWLFKLPGIFDVTGYYGFLGLYLAGLSYFFFNDLQKFNWPQNDEINRRIENDSPLKHRPLSENKDTPFAQTSDNQIRLWLIEQQRRKDELTELQPAKIRSKLASLDKFALRLFTILVLCAGVFVAGPEWKDRIFFGLLPFDNFHQSSSDSDLHFWVTPPEYTEISQTIIQGEGQIEDVLQIPEGSTLKILATSRFGSPVLTHDGNEYPLERLDGNSFGLEMEVPKTKLHSLPSMAKRNNTLGLIQFFRTRLSVPYEIIPDTSPQIAIQGQLRLDTHNEGNDLNSTFEFPPSPIIIEGLPDDSIFEEGEMENMPSMPSIPVENNLKKPKRIENAHVVLDDGQLQIPLSVYDDYGVQTLSMSMTLDPMIEQAPLGWEEHQTRSIMSPKGTVFDLQPVYDFTDNPWAGLPVVINLTVTDFLGQSSELTPLGLSLPERSFEHPVAQKLIAARKQLAWSPVLAAQDVQRDLEKILAFPQDYEDDLTVFLALRSAASRLYYSSTKQSKDYEDTKAVMALLWDTALRVEDGNLSLAARNLRDAQMALEDALVQDNISDERINQLMNDLRQAMAEYLTELQKELQKEFAKGEDMLITPEMLAELIDPDALAEFLDQMQSELHNGNRSNAQEMLSDLQRMLDMLNPNMAGPMPQDMQAMAEGINELQELIDKQIALKDQTQKQATKLEREQKFSQSFGNIQDTQKDTLGLWGLNDFPPAPNEKNFKLNKPSIDTSANRIEQEALRYILGELMLETAEALPEIPETMGLAEQEMRKSSDALEKNKPDTSVPYQEKAIEYLQQAQDDLQEQLQQRMQQMVGDSMSFNDGRGHGSPRYDPLGRPMGRDENGNQIFPGSRVKIPDEAERRRVQEILKILRDRSSELNRPREELDYFRRILRQF